MSAHAKQSVYRVLTAAMLGFTTLTSAFTSSIFSAGTRAVAAEFDVSAEVGILGVSFYVLGFAFGPTMWAPLSELKGRKMPLVVAMFGFSIFTVAVGAAKDLQTILICRFFSGFFGACPLAVVAAVFSDMFNNATRGIAITIFSMAVFTGPLLAPFIGGYIVDSHLGWRWTMYITAIMGFVSFGLDLIFLEETYPPQILVAKAAELRRRTGNHFIHAKQEEIEVDLQELLEKNFSRPMKLLFQEPIILLLSIYMSFVYGILYLFLTAYPLVFTGVHGFSAGPSGLCFFGMIIGELIAGIVVLLQQPWYQRKLAANNGVPIPEWRLPSIIAGGVAFCIGIFWVRPLSLVLTKPWSTTLTCISIVWMDWLPRGYQLFGSHRLRSPHWLRSHVDLPPGPQLPGRRIPDVRRLGHRRQHVHAVSRRRLFPAFRDLHVQWNGHPVGLDAPGLCGGGAGAYPGHLLALRRQDPGQEQARAYIAVTRLPGSDGDGRRKDCCSAVGGAEEARGQGHRSCLILALKRVSESMTRGSDVCSARSSWTRGYGCIMIPICMWLPQDSWA